ncbi:hypothetical protein PISMIDRAFT_19235 [Pisolithus microcarpus 441]|uniref:Uncharacterized protein n=1 Tax=Pisolithus microcarpus 441 TaxID=765257 RepID=A0A0C9XHH7_9AGAM|nr:hypothetical protein PISMIDRAFT_19235 [Pisolithus microcarpus 441]
MDSPTKAKLDLLRLYLKNLPNSIPFVDPGGMSQYGFDFFLVDDEDMADKGPVGAINCQLEIWLGHWNNGPILFMEQGPSLCKLTDLFKEWFRGLSSDPEIPILHKWLDDLITAAEYAYSSTNTKMKVLGLHGVEVEPLVAMKKQDGNGTLVAIVVKEGRKKQKETGDYHIMKFIVCCGIPPTVVDSAEWKEVVAALNPHYQPPSSTTLTEKLIVNEAAKITATINKILLGCHNLTITFDGGKIRRPKSTYSVHVTTATRRRTFCMELDDASQLSHTAKYILEVLERVGAYPWFSDV